MTKKTNTLKSSFDQLDEIVFKIESGNLSLEESLELYKKALDLAKKLKTKLSDFESEVEILQKEFDSVVDNLDE